MTQVAPRIHRIGAEMIAAYAVEDGGDVVIVDAGTPADWKALPRVLEAMGRALDDVRAVILTHGHDDHRGFAERARRTGIPVRVATDDAALARGEVPNQAKTVGPYRIGPAIRFLWFSARTGVLRTPRLQAVETFDSGATLDVPGAPRVVHVPGHTNGSVAFHFAGHDAALVGDSLNTLAVTTGRTGPRLSPFNFDRGRALASLATLEQIEATHVLPGHGAPWNQGVRRATELARAVEREEGRT
jgi:glyoxylase-like metal-dependent hydrolase (beta-lactamase superfamily II)